jgi:hypothetical protein
MGNVTSSVAAKLAFFPPEPATYEVLAEGAGLRMTGVLPDANVDVHALPTRAGTRVVAAFWRHPSARLTLLYSHGNAADLGQMLGLFMELRSHLRVNIMRSLALSRPHATCFRRIFFLIADLCCIHLCCVFSAMANQLTNQPYEWLIHQPYENKVTPINTSCPFFYIQQAF